MALCGERRHPNQEVNHARRKSNLKTKPRRLRH
jgi:hypothetical protein